MFFEQTFQTVLNGIDAPGGPMGAITNIANAILLLCALFLPFTRHTPEGETRGSASPRRSSSSWV